MDDTAHRPAGNSRIVRELTFACLGRYTLNLYGGNRLAEAPSDEKPSNSSFASPNRFNDISRISNVNNRFSSLIHPPRPLRHPSLQLKAGCRHQLPTERDVNRELRLRATCD